MNCTIGCSWLPHESRSDTGLGAVGQGCVGLSEHLKKRPYVNVSELAIWFSLG